MNGSTTAGDLSDFAVFPVLDEITNQAASLTITLPTPGLGLPMSFEVVGVDPDVDADNAEFAGAFRRLDEVAHVSPNWDSYGSAPPTDEAVSVAKQLIQQVYRMTPATGKEAALPFSIAPLSGGGIQLEWARGDMAIEVEVGEHGRLGYLLVSGEKDKPQYEEADDVSEINLLALISSVVSG